MSKEILGVQIEQIKKKLQRLENELVEKEFAVERTEAELSVEYSQLDLLKMDYIKAGGKWSLMLPKVLNE